MCAERGYDMAAINGVELLKPGTWNGQAYTKADIAEIAANFATAGFSPPVKLGHNTDQEKDGAPAYGWVDKLHYDPETGVITADLREVPEKLAEAIKAGAYRAVSAEIYARMRDGAGKIKKNVLRALAILGADVPAVKGLAPLDQAAVMLTELLPLYVVMSGIDTEPVGLVGAEHKMEMKENNVSEVEEITALKERLRIAEDANKSLMKDVREERICRLSAEASAFAQRLVKTGRLPVAKKGAVEALYLALADSASVVKLSDGNDAPAVRLLIEAFGELKPLVELSELSEVGGCDAKALPEDPGKALDELAREAVLTGKVKTYSAGVELVRATRPEIYENYIKGGV